MKLKFDPKDWEDLTRYLKEWDEWRRRERIGRPGYTTDAIYLVPHIIVLLNAQEKLERLTWVLIFLTIILAFLAIIELFP